MMRIAILGVCSLTLCGLAGSATSGQARVAAKATPAQQAALFDRVKTLQGTWVGKDDKGQEHVASTFTVSSAGSIVREVMLPGSDHEMTNVYHMDGPTLVMTHYCAMGNQPRMRASIQPPSREIIDPLAAPGGYPYVIDLKFDSVTNLHDSGEPYMGGMKLVFVDADHVKTDWTSYQDGKAQPHTTFEMWRKK